MEFGLQVGGRSKVFFLSKVWYCVLSKSFVLAPPCLLPAPAFAQAQVSQRSKGVTRVQVLCNKAFTFQLTAYIRACGPRPSAAGCLAAKTGRGEGRR